MIILIIKSIIRADLHVLDIGSNDGIPFLNFFSNKKNNSNSVGSILSAAKFQKYYKKNVNLIVDYFSKENLKNVEV